MKTKPVPSVFLAQPGGNLVGPGKRFKDHWELCRALREIGARGVTLPACEPYLNLAQATGPKATEYCRDLLKRYEDCGTPAIRLEGHVPGNLMLMHTSNAARFADFGKSVPFSVGHYERLGDQLFELIVNANANLGFREIVAFSGGRGWQAALYPWPAYPPQFRLHILALVIRKWIRRLEQAAAGGQIICFELHPEQDISSPLLLKLLRDMLAKISTKAAGAVKANGDASHPTLIGDNAAMHMKFLFEQNLLGAIHLKDGEQQEGGTGSVSEGASAFGDFEPRYSDSRRRFCGFGMGQADWKAIRPFYMDAHEQSEFGMNMPVELECSRFPNMWQGAQLSLENARRFIADEDMLDVSDITPEPADGDWEAFCSGSVPASALLQMTPEELAGVEEILARFLN